MLSGFLGVFECSSDGKWSTPVGNTESVRVCVLVPGILDPGPDRCVNLPRLVLLH